MKEQQNILNKSIEYVKKDILFHAKHLNYYNDLLIDQCNNWQSAKEGNENLMKKILEKKRGENL